MVGKIITGKCYEVAWETFCFGKIVQNSSMDQSNNFLRVLIFPDLMKMWETYGNQSL